MNRDEFDGWAVYPWQSTDVRPAVVVLDEDTARFFASSYPGGAEVRACSVGLANEDIDDLRSRVADLEAEVEREKAYGEDKEKEAEQNASDAVKAEKALDALQAKYDQLLEDLSDANDTIAQLRNAAA